MYMSYNTIIYEKHRNVGYIWLNRPDAANAQNEEMLHELDHALQEADQDSDVRVVVLGGKGRHFSAGHDLKQAEIRAAFNVEQRWAFEEKVYFDYCMRILDFPKPTIAQVQGACVAAGFMVANMCDLIIAADDAFFSDPVVQNLAAAGVEVLIHPWVLGMRHAKYLLFTGERISAQEALALGMVNKVVPREMLAEETRKVAEKIAQAPPFAMKLIKKSLNQTLDIQGLRNALTSHFAVHQLTHTTSEWNEVKQRGLSGTIPRRQA